MGSVVKEILGTKRMRDSSFKRSRKYFSMCGRMHGSTIQLASVNTLTLSYAHSTASYVPPVVQTNGNASTCLLGVKHEVIG